MKITDEKLEEILKILPDYTPEFQIEFEVAKTEDWVFLEANNYLAQFDFKGIQYLDYDSGDMYTPPMYTIKSTDKQISNLVIYIGQNEVDLTADQYTRAEEVIKNLINCD